MVVAGMDTKRTVGGGDVIKSLRPMPLDPRTVRRHHKPFENRTADSQLIGF